METSGGGLFRHIGLRSATALVIANIIGAGIFTSTGFQAESLGHPGYIFALWIVGGVLAFCGALCYAAGLVPEISNDVVNIDNAMRWGFAWRKGPFELLDALGPNRVIAKLEADGQPLPAMLQVLKDAGGDSFYRNDGGEFLGLDGAYHPVI